MHFLPLLVVIGLLFRRVLNLLGILIWCRSVAMPNYPMRIHLGLSCEIILVGGVAMTNYHMIIHLGLSCEIQSHESNTIHI